MKQKDTALNQTEWELRCQLLATMAGLASSAMALVVLWASWRQAHGVLPAADAPCLAALPRVTMGLGLLGGAYSLYTAWQARGEAPVGTNRLLLAAAVLAAASTALEAYVLFFGTQGLSDAEQLDIALDVLE